jgi:hypothetical protein
MKTLILWVTCMAAVPVLAAKDRPGVTAGGDTGPQHRFSVLGGDTVGSGANVLEAALGFPGLDLTFVHGVRQDLDLGGRMTVNGAFEGLALAPATGVKGQALTKFRLLDAGRVKLGLELAPGAFLYSVPYSSAAGVELGAAVKMGIAATERLGVVAGVETPFFYAFAPLRVPYPYRPGALVYPAGLYVPALFGGGVEYAVVPNVLLTANARMGPTFITASNLAVFTLQAQCGVAWRI